MKDFKPYTIRLLKKIGKYDKGAIGIVTSDCGCVSNPRITVSINGYEIITSKRLTKGYEHYEIL